MGTIMFYNKKTKDSKENVFELPRPILESKPITRTVQIHERNKVTMIPTKTISKPSKHPLY